jgi:RNA polymerase sigma-70 factor (ECF subfamily)
LRQLADDQRLAVVLHYLDGLSVREIARQLGRSESSVESLLSRGRDHLRAILEVPR